MTKPEDVVRAPVDAVVLLPCPFCGRKPEVQHIVGKSSEPVFLRIICKSCPLDFGDYTEDKQKSMVIAWNKRKPKDA
jgi:Lar family restriction alleviation protein